MRLKTATLKREALRIFNCVDYLEGVTKAVKVNSLIGVCGSFDLITTDFSIVPLNDKELNVTRTLLEPCARTIF